MPRELPYQQIRNILDGVISNSLANIELRAKGFKNWESMSSLQEARVDKREQILNEALDRMVATVQPPPRRYLKWKKKQKQKHKGEAKL